MVVCIWDEFRRLNLTIFGMSIFSFHFLCLIIGVCMSRVVANYTNLIPVLLGTDHLNPIAGKRLRSLVFNLCIPAPSDFQLTAQPVANHAMD